MTFEKIDDTTLRCILTEEDLEERGFGLSDFIKNPYKIHGFLREMIEAAATEFDMDIKEGMLALQVAPLPNNELAITFSIESEREEASDMASQIKKMIGSAMAKAGVSNYMNENISQETEQKADNQNIQETEQKNVIKNKFVAIYRFDSYEAFEKFALQIKTEGMLKTSLYRSQGRDEYLFVMKQGKETIEKTRNFCLRISEYAQLVSADETYLSYLNEHYQLVIKEQAVAKLQIMA